MNHLFQALAERVDAWRAARYECADFPTIGEVLDFALEDPSTDQLRYLRRAQFRALETYWYLRLVLNTPKVPELYATLFADTALHDEGKKLVRDFIFQT